MSINYELGGDCYAEEKILFSYRNSGIDYGDGAGHGGGLWQIQVYADPNSVSYIDCHCYRHRYPHSHFYPECDSYRYGVANGYSVRYRYAHGNPQSTSYNRADPDGHRDAYPHR